MNRHSLTILLSMAIALAGNCASSADETMKSRIDRLVQPYLDAEIVVGMSVGVVHNGEATVVGYGQLSHEDTRVPDGDTVYEIGSITKVFTGILLGDAVSRGRVKLDQPVRELLPEGVTMPTGSGRPITLIDLATHVSGLPPLPTNFKPADATNPYADYTVAQLYAFLLTHEPVRPPGEKHEYCNLGMGLLGHALALEAGKSYGELFKARISQQLGMNDTTITLSGELRSRLATPHTAGGEVAKNWDAPTLAGAGAVRSTVDDMLRFLKANLSPPPGELGEAIELAWQVHQKPLTAGDFAMGLAWHVAHDGQTHWHNGQTGGYAGMMLVNREHKIAVVVLTNTATSEIDVLAEDLIRMLAGAAVEPRKFDKPLAVPRKVMRRYVGKYAFNPQVVLTVRLEGDRLSVQLTGQTALRVFATSETEWAPREVEAVFTFQVDENGKCEAVELFQNGIRQMARRIGSEKVARVAPEVMRRYMGKYQLSPEFVLDVTLEGDTLQVQATGQQALRLYPKSDTEWAPREVEAVLIFDVDSSGKCQSVELFQNGIRQRARRIGAKVEPRPIEEQVTVAHKIMRRYVGKYQLAPQVVLTVTLKEGNLTAQLTGQPAIRVFPKSETEWFPREFEAVLTFQVDANGKCQSVELFQNGIRQTAKRIR